MVDKRNTRRREIASGGQTEPSAREIQEPAFNMVWNETMQGVRGGQGDGRECACIPCQKGQMGILTQRKNNNVS